MGTGEIVLALAIFLCLAGAGLGAMAVNERLPAHFRHDDTSAIVRLVADIFVVMTSLVLGLMVNQARSTFEAVDKNVHALATELILLDRALQEYGPRLLGDRASERLLRDVGDSLKAIKPAGAGGDVSWEEAWRHYHQVVDLRWDLVEQSEGTVPGPFLAMVVLWLILIFGSFGYRAPRNLVVIVSLALSAGLIAGSKPEAENSIGDVRKGNLRSARAPFSSPRILHPNTFEQSAARTRAGARTEQKPPSSGGAARSDRSDRVQTHMRRGA